MTGRWSEYDGELDEVLSSDPVTEAQFERYRNDPVAFAEVVLGVELPKHAADMLRLRAELDADELLSRPPVQSRVTTMHRYYANRGECVRDDKGNFHHLDCVSCACTGCGPEHPKQVS